MSCFFMSGGFATEYQIMFMDLFCGMLMVTAMCMAKPNEKLSKVIPLQKLTEFKTSISFFVPSLIFIAAWVVLFLSLSSMPWYSALTPMEILLPAELWGFRGDGYLIECTFLLIM